VIIGPGVVIGSGATMGAGNAGPTGNIIFEYAMGNSASYNGQGLDLSRNGFLGPDGSTTGTNFMFDLSADYANGAVGNIGKYYTNETGSGNIVGSNFITHGPMSYLSFNGNVSGSGQYIDSNYVNNYSIPSGSSYSIFAVVRLKGFTGSGGSFNGGGIVGGNNMYFQFVPPGLLGNPYPVLCANNTNTYPAVLDNTTQYQLNTWYAIALTYDSGSQTMRLYVNGQAIGGSGASTGVMPISGNEPLYWGTLEGSNWLNGDLGVMTAWNYALSPSEIASYTTDYGYQYGIQTVKQDNDMPTQSYSQLFSVPGQYTFQVPQGVSSVSMVAVGAGGGGTYAGYSPPGGDSYVYSQWSHFNVNMNTNAGYSGAPFITFDCTTGNNNALLGNVAPGWLFTSIDLNNYYPNRALIEGNVYGMVLAVDSTDTANVVLTISPSLDSVSGNVYNFLGQTIVGAQGALEINNSQYKINNNGTPGPRAKPIWGDSGGKGGVVDSLGSWPIGGAGAGGYGTNDAVVAFDPTQTYVYDGGGNYGTGEANIILSLSNNNLSVEATANNSSYPGIATGTYEIVFGQKVMFSLTVDTSASSGSQGIGFGGSGAELASYVGGTTDSGGFYNDGGFYSTGAPAYSGYPTFTTGDVVDIAIDNSNALGQLTWVRVNGGDWMGNPTANPATGTNGITISVNTEDGSIYLMTTQGAAGDIGKWSINTSNAYSTPSGYTFVAGLANAGSNGGGGSNQELPTYTDGEGTGLIGGSGGGGGGLYSDIGSGGGGVGLYGVGDPGTHGGWVDDNTYTGNSPQSEWQAQAVGGRGGSRRGSSGTQGGMASAWAGGAGGWPGGGGGSAPSLWDGGNGGALAYKNNVSTYPGTPGNPGGTLQVIVGQGGWGGGISNETYYGGGKGGDGAVRIVWPGDTRQFPNTSVGIDALVTSLTINPGDFVFYGGSPANSITVGSGSIGNNYVTIYSASELVAQTIFAFFRSVGAYTQNSLNSNDSYDPNNFNAYIFEVTWGAGSTVPNGLVRMGYNGTTGQLNITTVDPTNTAYETANPANQDPGGATIPGTFNFSATFTLRTPAIQSGGLYWC